MALLPVTDLKLPLPFALVWRKDNASALLAKLMADVRSLPEVEAYLGSSIDAQLRHARGAANRVCTEDEGGLM